MGVNQQPSVSSNSTEGAVPAVIARGTSCALVVVMTHDNGIAPSRDQVTVIAFTPRDVHTLLANKEKVHVSDSKND